jgi:hypothetical protein
MGMVWLRASERDVQDFALLDHGKKVATLQVTYSDVSDTIATKFTLVDPESLLAVRFSQFHLAAAMMNTVMTQMNDFDGFPSDIGVPLVQM